MNAVDRPHVVIVGAGMARLATVRALSRAPVTVQLIDTRNYTTFPPLLCMHATCGGRSVSADMGQALAHCPSEGTSVITHSL